MSLKDDFYSFIKLLEAGDFMQAIEEFYDENIIQMENSDAPVIGKAKLKLNEESNLQTVQSLNVKVKDVLMDEGQGLVWGQMIIKFSGKSNDRKVLIEAFKQNWKNGKIVRQQFFYDKIKDEGVFLKH